MSNYHYKKTRLDDALSAEILDRYLESLDPNRSYFLQEDIAAFSKYRDALDNELRDAKLHAAFDIFTVFLKRFDDRVDYAKGLLEREFNFEVNEDYVIDRSKAPWTKNHAELDETWRKRVKNDVLALHVSEQSRGQTLAQLAATVKKRYEALARYTHQLNADDVYQFFINAYTTSVEPHTAYFSPRTSEDFRIRMSLSLEGIGAVLQADNEYAMIQKIIPGSPADKSRMLHPEDRITGIGDGPEGAFTNVVGWRLENVVDLIRGPKGTAVRLQILPKETGHEGSTRSVTLTRDTIKLEDQAARKSVIEVPADGTKSKIGIIKLPAFYMDFAARARGESDYRSTTRDVRQLISELTRDGVDGIIMDLRGNGGGSLAEATELAGLFIASGPIVQVKDASGHIEIKEDSDPSVTYSGALVVLVDGQSASASEIFAGAIQDYRRGVIVGQPTFGKGTVQDLIDLDRIDNREGGRLGQLKETVAQFFRVSGGSTQHRGVVPDIAFHTALYSADKGERGLAHALPWDQVKPAKFVPVGASAQALVDTRWRHERRIQASPLFHLILTQAETERKTEEKNRVSLVEKDRRAERDAAEKRQRERDEQFRRALGLSTLSADGAGQEKKERDPGDAMLYETANILHDLIDLSRPNATTRQANGSRPETPGLAGR